MCAYINGKYTHNKFKQWTHYIVIVLTDLSIMLKHWPAQISRSHLLGVQVKTHDTRGNNCPTKFYKK